MMQLLFIPSLLAGDTDAFFHKIAIVVLLWLFVIFASGIDLITGIQASRRAGNKKTTSWGLRKTLSKDLQYLAMLVMLLVIDIALSALSEHLSIFATPICSSVGTVLIVIIEGLSVMENTQKGRSKEEDKVDDMQALLTAAIETLGSDKVRELMEKVTKNR